MLLIKPFDNLLNDLFLIEVSFNQFKACFAN